MPLPSKGEFNVKPLKGGVGRQHVEDMLGVMYRLIGSASPEVIQITGSDDVTPSGDSAHILLQPASGNADTLLRIQPDNFEQGNVLFVQIENGGDEVLLTHEDTPLTGGEISFPSGRDYTVNSTTQLVAMQLIGSLWVTRWMAGAQAKRAASFEALWSGTLNYWRDGDMAFVQGLIARSAGMPQGTFDFPSSLPSEYGSVSDASFATIDAGGNPHIATMVGSAIRFEPGVNGYTGATNIPIFMVYQVEA